MQLPEPSPLEAPDFEVSLNSEDSCDSLPFEGEYFSCLSSLDSQEHFLNSSVNGSSGIGLVLWSKGPDAKIIAVNSSLASLIPWAAVNQSWSSSKEWNSSRSHLELQQLAESTMMVSKGEQPFRVQHLIASVMVPLIVKIVSTQHHAIWIVSRACGERPQLEPSVPKVSSTTGAPIHVHPATTPPALAASHNSTSLVPVRVNEEVSSCVPSVPSAQSSLLTALPEVQTSLRKELIPIANRPKKIRPWAGSLKSFMLQEPHTEKMHSKRRRRCRQD